MGGWLIRRWYRLRDNLQRRRVASFRVPLLGRTYFTLKINSPYELPPDASWQVAEMIYGRRPFDVELVARVWFDQQMKHADTHRQFWKELRLLERKIQAQRAELNRLRPPFKATA